jgi:hypothetical protein
MPIPSRKLDPAVAEEDKKVRYLRMMVDLSISMIYQGQISFEDAQGICRNLRRLAVKLFPGKGEAFDIIYGSRFRRVFCEVYGIEERDSSRELS